MALTPFRQTAKIALMKYGEYSTPPVVGEEECEKAARTWSYDELQKAVGPESSMKAGVIALAKELELTPEETEKFINLALGKDKVEATQEDKEFYNKLGQKFNALPNKGRTVVRILSAIHNNWVETPSNADKFNNPKRVGQRYQHLPLEMIGFEEAAIDDIFFKPVLDAMGVEVSQAEKEAAYAEIAYEFYDKNGFLNENGIDKEAVIKKIMEGKKFYPSLTKDVNEATDREVAKAIAEKSIQQMANVKMRG